MSPAPRPAICLALALALGLGSALGCGQKVNPGGNCPLAPGPVNFAIVEQEVLTYCTPCHAKAAKNRFGAPTNINYDSYAAAVENADAGNMDILGGRMPPAQALDANRRCIMDAWVKNNYAR